MLCQELWKEIKASANLPVGETHPTAHSEGSRQAEGGPAEHTCVCTDSPCSPRAGDRAWATWTPSLASPGPLLPAPSHLLTSEERGLAAAALRSESREAKPHTPCSQSVSGAAESIRLPWNSKASPHVQKATVSCHWSSDLKKGSSAKKNLISEADASAFPPPCPPLSFSPAATADGPGVFCNFFPISVGCTKWPTTCLASNSLTCKWPAK